MFTYKYRKALYEFCRSMSIKKTRALFVDVVGIEKAFFDILAKPTKDTETENIYNAWTINDKCNELYKVDLAKRVSLDDAEKVIIPIR